MRKYDKKNKKYIGVILGILLIIIVIFSLFIKRVIDVGKIVYNIDSNSVVFDNDKNMITTTTEATIKMKWSGNYYMIYNDDMINLGDHSVIYNASNSNISLYGTYYEVLNTGDVEILEDENIIASSVKSHFYKLDDRKYLIIDRMIESDDGLLVTSNYLLIDIDKSGNATLLNNNINLKTFQPIIFKTSAFTFDVANEILNFGGEDIDLKDIIGSTNEYGKHKKGSGSGDETGNGSDSSGTGSGSANGVAGEQTSVGGSGGSGNSETTTSYNGNSYDSGVSDAAVEQIINATKNTSIIRVTTSLTSISVDYVIYDPENNYQSVFVDVIKADDDSSVTTAYMSKNDTNLTISNLECNTLYYLYFRYNYYNSTTEAYETITFDSIDVVTKFPKMSLVITSVTSSKINYKISLDDYYNVVSGEINLSVDNVGISKTYFPSGLGSTDGFTGSIDISKVNIAKNSVVKLDVYNVQINLITVSDPDVSFKFVY